VGGQSGIVGPSVTRIQAAAEFLPERAASGLTVAAWASGSASVSAMQKDVLLAGAWANLMGSRQGLR
jgi:hypothetical protein